MSAQTSIEAHKNQNTLNTVAGGIDPTRGLIILVARLSARKHKLNFPALPLLCYSQKHYGKNEFLEDFNIRVPTLRFLKAGTQVDVEFRIVGERQP